MLLFHVKGVLNRELFDLKVTTLSVSAKLVFSKKIEKELPFRPVHSQVLT